VQELWLSDPSCCIPGPQPFFAKKNSIRQGAVLKDGHCVGHQDTSIQGCSIGTSLLKGAKEFDLGLIRALRQGGCAWVAANADSTQWAS